MQKFIFVLLLTLTYSVNANASFTNLDFESGRIQSNNQDFGFLDWEIAVPGWSHSNGDDTSSVFYGTVHVGGTQWFHLNDTNLIDENVFNQVPSIHQGNFSLSFFSGSESGLDPDSPWVNAYISQTGTIPENAKYIQLLAEAPFQLDEPSEVPLEVSVGDEIISMISLGQGLYRGDISGFSGLTAELKITNSSLREQYPIAIDNISFAPVPLPASAVFLISGLFGLPLIKKRK